MYKRAVVIIALFFCLSLRAQIKLPAIFSDNMVMRQNADAPLWGYAMPNETVSLRCSWSGDEYKTRTDNSGKWRFVVAVPASGGTHSITIKSNGSEVTLNNILLGESGLPAPQFRTDQWHGLTYNNNGHK